MGQLQMLFRASDPHGRNVSEPLAYVKVFIPGERSVKWVGGEYQFCADDDVEMFRVRRKCNKGIQVGRVVALKDIWRPVELVPRFGKECDKGWTCNTAVEEAKELFLNPFSDKITYQHVY